MPETYVTVATYTDPMEAEMARGRLQAEGIPAQMIGNETAEPFSGMVGLVGSIHLRVPEANREEAVGLLAQAEEAHLDKGWEQQAPFDAGVWVCPLCGEPVDEALTVCPACETPRDPGSAQGIQDRSRLSGSPATGAPGPASEDIQRPAGIGTQAPVPHPAEVEEEVDLPPAETFLGDDLARRACLAGLFTLMCAGLAPFAAIIAVFGFIPLGLYSLWLLARLGLFPGPLSGRGMAYCYGAIVLVLVALFLVLMFLAQLPFFAR
jgi:hypothetical protein